MTETIQATSPPRPQDIEQDRREALMRVLGQAEAEAKELGAHHVARFVHSARVILAHHSATHSGLRSMSEERAHYVRALLELGG
jgi:hypothetical protein